MAKCCACEDGKDGPLSGRIRCVCIFMLVFSILTIDPLGIILASIVICRCCGMKNRRRCIITTSSVFLTLTVIALGLVVAWGALFVSSGKDCRDSISCRYTTDGAGCDGGLLSGKCCDDGKFVNEDNFWAQPDGEKTCIPKPPAPAPSLPPKARQLAEAIPLLGKAVPALEQAAGGAAPLLRKVLVDALPRALFPLSSRLLHGPPSAAAASDEPSRPTPSAAMSAIAGGAAARPARQLIEWASYWKNDLGECTYCDDPLEGGSGVGSTYASADTWCCDRDKLGDGKCNPECAACDADGDDCEMGELDLLPTCCKFDLGDLLGQHCHSTDGDWDWICDLMDEVGYIVLGAGLAIILIQCGFYIAVIYLACKLDPNHGAFGGYGTKAYAVDTGFGLARA